jgi:hypothetical protein
MEDRKHVAEARETADGVIGVHVHLIAYSIVSRQEEGNRVTR